MQPTFTHIHDSYIPILECTNKSRSLQFNEFKIIFRVSSLYYQRIKFWLGVSFHAFLTVAYYSVKSKILNTNINLCYPVSTFFLVNQDIVSLKREAFLSGG